MPDRITIKNGEGKTIQFTVTRDGGVLDLSSADVRFCVKANLADTSYKIDKVTEDFDLSQASVGVVSVTILASETTATLMPAGDYICELKIIITVDSNVDKSAIINFVVQPSIIHD